MLKQIYSYIITHHLPTAPARLVVALSGGADSVALLLILQQLGYELTAAHCNFHLRGDESDRDEYFVRRLCEKVQVPLHIKHFATEEYAQANGISIEMAARQLRYEWFELLRKEIKAIAIAVAHHADDNAETLLLNLVRGTGLHGLKGMLPQNGHIIRPLLNVHRKDLEAFLKLQEQDFVTDSTNLETKYKRNKIRHEVLPLLRHLNPAIDESLSQTAQRLAEAEELYKYAIRRIEKEVCQKKGQGLLIDLEKLNHCPCPATLLHEILSPFGFTSSTIANMATQLERTSGTYFESERYIALFNRGQLCVHEQPQSISPCTLPYEGEITLDNNLRINVRRYSKEHLIEIPKQRAKVTIDTATVKGKLYIRNYLKGDRFQPFGMKGSKLVSDYLTDKHRSLYEKFSTLVICDDNGIVWLVNERVDQRVAITSRTTEVIEISLCDELISTNES